MTEAQQYDRLYGIMKETRRNKRRGRDSVEFEANWTPLLVRAMDDRNDRTLRIKQNSAFLNPRPRWREIFATEFGGRMDDHEICDVVIPKADEILSPYTFNNRKEMGSQAAINQLLEHIYEVTEGYTKQARIVKIDFSGLYEIRDNFSKEMLIPLIAKIAGTSTEPQMIRLNDEAIKYMNMLGFRDIVLLTDDART